MTDQPIAFLSDLGTGGTLLMWGVRAVSVGQCQCPALTTGFARAFEGEAVNVLSHLALFVKKLGTEGYRPVIFGAPGCRDLTHDELSVVSSVAAAQLGQKCLRNMHLQWLLGRKPSYGLQDTADNVADLFGCFDYRLSVTQAKTSRSMINRPFTVYTGGLMRHGQYKNDSPRDAHSQHTTE